MNIIQNPASTANYTPGREGTKVIRGILHTEQGFEAGTDSWFANPASHVSTHYSVGLDGTIRQHVSEGDTAWGAGNWTYNLDSIQIEFEDDNNPNGVTRTPAQLAAGAWLMADISRRNGFPISAWIRHGDVPSNDHPSCPGNLPVDQLKASAQAELGGDAPHPVVLAADTHTQPFVAWGPENVKITVSVLKVHAVMPVAGGGEDAGTFANTTDGMVHLNNIVKIQGYAYGLQVGDSSVWLIDQFGRWLFAGCTDFFDAAPSISKIQTVTTEQYTFITDPGILTVMPDIGANIRTEPLVNETNISSSQERRVVLSTTGFVVDGGSIGGNRKWWKVPAGYVSDAVVSFAPAPPAPSVPDQPLPVNPVAPPDPAPVSPNAVQFTSASTGGGIASDIIAPTAVPVIPLVPPTSPTQGASLMSIRDYLVAFIAWVMKPFM